MKKIILYLIMATSILGAQLKDGRYFVQEKEYSYGWASTASMEIEKGKIVKITTDKVNKKGELASKNDWYNKEMFAKNKTNPKEFSIILPKNFIKGLKKDYELKEVDFEMPKIDIIAGATDSSKSFKKMMEFLVEKSKAGTTGKYKIKL